MKSQADVCGINAASVDAAWQFLRRNSDFRADYMDYLNVRVDLEAEHGPVQSWTEKSLLHDPRAWYYWPPKNTLDSENAWRIRAVCEGRDPWKALIHKGYARRWGMVVMVNPNQTSSEGVQFIPEEQPPFWYRVEDIDQELSEGEGVPSIFYVRLDASKSVTRQLSTLRKGLVAQQKRLKQYGLKWRTSLHTEKWPLYLRVLDAIAAGATTKEIANKEFAHVPDQYPDYAGQARVRATHEQALVLVHGGYRRILEAEA